MIVGATIFLKNTCSLHLYNASQCFSQLASEVKQERGTATSSHSAAGNPGPQRLGHVPSSRAEQSPAEADSLASEPGSVS